MFCLFVVFEAGDSESKNILDAFFLGKALAEAVNERLESAVGEFLSTVGRLQAEQQKQVLEFQVFSPGPHLVKFPFSCYCLLTVSVFSLLSGYFP